MDKNEAKEKIRGVFQKTDEHSYFINFLILSVQSKGAARVIKVACHLFSVINSLDNKYPFWKPIDPRSVL